MRPPSTVGDRPERKRAPATQPPHHERSASTAMRLGAWSSGASAVQRRLVVRPRLDRERALARRRHHHVRRQRVRRRRRDPEPERPASASTAASTSPPADLPQTRVDVAAQVLHGQPGNARRSCARRRCSRFRSRLRRGSVASRKHQHVARIGAPRNGGEHEPFVVLHGKILGRVHGDVHLVAFEGVDDRSTNSPLSPAGESADGAPRSPAVTSEPARSRPRLREPARGPREPARLRAQNAGFRSGASLVDRSRPNSSTSSRVRSSVPDSERSFSSTIGSCRSLATMPRASPSTASRSSGVSRESRLAKRSSSLAARLVPRARSARMNGASARSDADHAAAHLLGDDLVARAISGRGVVARSVSATVEPSDVDHRTPRARRLRGRRREGRRGRVPHRGGPRAAGRAARFRASTTVPAAPVAVTSRSALASAAGSSSSSPCSAPVRFASERRAPAPVQDAQVPTPRRRRCLTARPPFGRRRPRRRRGRRAPRGRRRDSAPASTNASGAAPDRGLAADVASGARRRVEQRARRLPAAPSASALRSASRTCDRIAAHRAPSSPGRPRRRTDARPRPARSASRAVRPGGGVDLARLGEQTLQREEPCVVVGTLGIQLDPVAGGQDDGLLDAVEVQGPAETLARSSSANASRSSSSIGARRKETPRARMAMVRRTSYLVSRGWGHPATIVA